MKLSKLVPSESKYLKAEDVGNMELKLTIDRIEQAKLDDGVEKAVLFFTKKEKGLCLNRTNAKTLIGAFGDDISGMAGQQVILFTQTVDFQGKSVLGIRLRPVSEVVDGDSIPF